MKTTNLFKSLLIGAAVALSLAMGSCIDNIDNSAKPSDNQQQTAEAQAKAQKFWAVVSQLVDVDDYTDDYEGKTFEPTYGIAQGTDGTRYVYTNTAAAAAARFADLVERDDIDENTQSYTYDDPDVGTFTYTKGTGRILATVEVRVKQIPNLKKIVYVPGAYANGSFQGRAYYRFGDVVARKVGNDMEYWICVRPSFGMEGKGDSHWVCLNSLPEKNVWHYYSKNSKKDYWLPQSLGTDKENMQNLAEMLYAIYFPEEWEANVKDIANTKLEMFSDFDKTNYEFHNQYFWKNVRTAWKHFGILENALDYTLGEEEFKAMLQYQGLHLLYYGYSWSTWRSWYCSLYDAWYKCGDANKEKNMHQASYKEVEKHMKDLNVDCRKMGQRYIVNYNQFFADNHPRLAVRHATGKELSSDGQYDVKGAIHGVTNLYRYYEYVNPTDDYTQNPEKTPAPSNKDDVQVGNIIAQNGKFYNTVADAQAAGTVAKAVVVYLGGTKRVEKGKDWNGLALALKDLDEYQVFCEAGMDKDLCSTNAAVDAHKVDRLDGWAMTERLANHVCNPSHRHPGAEDVWNLEKLEGCSEWFIPSTGQWNLAIIGMDGQPYSDLTNPWSFGYNILFWENANIPDAALNSGKQYMTSTEGTLRSYADDYNKVDGKIITFNMIFLNMLKKTDTYRIRPFVAFKYGNGGSEDPAEPWSPLTAPKAQSWLGEDGQFYEDPEDAFTNTGYLPVGYVAYYGNPGSVDVDGKKYRGLIIGTYAKEFAGLTWYQMDGSLEQYKTRLPDNVRQQKGFSPWFIGKKEHWQMAFEQGFGLEFKNDAVTENVKGSSLTELNEVFKNNHLGTSILSGPYWTATANNEGEACYIDLIQGHTIQFQMTDQTTTEVDGKQMRIRPMIAF